MSKKSVFIFGASGSIGLQTIEVLKQQKENFKIIGVSVFNNVDVLQKILQDNDDIEFAFSKNKNNLQNNFTNVKFWNDKLIGSLPKDINCDIVVNAISGFSGLEVSLWAIKNNKILLLANKESLVVAGSLINELLEKNSNAKLFPLDSEHAAIWQCLESQENKNDIDKILLTASGGNFLNYKLSDLENIKLENVITHPNWNMGKKITIDSSTMFNKALEIIEAYHLFKTKNIQVLINQQSIIHSMVQFKDKSILAQMSLPDMRQVINYFLNYPKKIKNNLLKEIDFTKLVTLTLQDIDEKRFLPISLAKQCLNENNSLAICLNAANEIAVEYFCQDKIKFNDITNIVEIIFNKTENKKINTYEEILEFDNFIREETRKIIKGR